MTFKNGLVTRIEPGVAGSPMIRHTEIIRACDRFLIKRGLMTAPSFRRSEWLFGRTPRRSK